MPSTALAAPAGRATGHHHPLARFPRSQPLKRTCTGCNLQRLKGARYSPLSRRRDSLARITGKSTSPSQRALDKGVTGIRQHQSRPVSRAGHPASGKPCGHCTLSMIVVSLLRRGLGCPDSMKQAARACGWLAVAPSGRHPGSRLGRGSASRIRATTMSATCGGLVRGSPMSLAASRASRKNRGRARTPGSARPKGGQPRGRR